MVYLNSADRRPGAPLATPRQVDDARAATIAALAEARHPETGLPLFPRGDLDRRGLRDRPGPRGLSPT